VPPCVRAAPGVMLPEVDARAHANAPAVEYYILYGNTCVLDLIESFRYYNAINHVPVRSEDGRTTFARRFSPVPRHSKPTAVFNDTRSSERENYNYYPQTFLTSKLLLFNHDGCIAVTLRRSDDCYLRTESISMEIRKPIQC
jgi:hypothetical protein